jgi:5-methylcytosine-specific restriction endonuclease McrA
MTLRTFVNPDPPRSGDGRFRRPSGQCQMCGIWVRDLVLDHIKPLSEGGLHDRTNLQYLCTKCNREKTNEENRRISRKIVHTDEAKEKIRQAALRQGQDPELMARRRQAQLDAYAAKRAAQDQLR